MFYDNISKLRVIVGKLSVLIFESCGKSKRAGNLAFDGCRCDVFLFGKQVKKGELGGSSRELVKAFHELRDALIKHFANTGTKIT